jgi:hypothetical protein
MNAAQSDPAPRAFSRRGLVKLAVRLVGPVLLVIVLLRLRDKGALLDALKTAAPLPLILAPLLTVLNTWLKVLRWDVLLGARGHRYGPVRAWTSFLSSMFVGLLTPGRVGDVLRAQYLRHDLGIPYAEGIAIIVVDRLCDIYVLLAFVAVGVARFSSVLASDLSVITWAGVALTALGPLVLFVPGFTRQAMRAIYRKLPAMDPTGEGLERFLVALRGQRIHHLAVAVFWTALAFAVNYAQGFLLARALHLDLSFFDVLCLMAIASLLGLLPISVSGVGVRELFFALVFPTLGYPAETGVVYGLGVFLVIYVSSVAIGFVSWHVAPPPVDAVEGRKA